MKFSSASLVVSAATVVVLGVPTPAPAPPGIPSASTARTLLAGLEIATPLSGGGYSRHLFPTWETIQGNCNAREFVLKRDGKDVQTNSACVAQSGTWVSPYDGVSFTNASRLDIDHMVPLKNAWISGASQWTTDERKRLANDITRPQLWAVSAHANRGKSDGSPDEWKPPLKTFWCTYAKSWVQVKSHYELTITDAEKGSLAGMLDSC
ncbi:secreted protein [Metarhizium rileyi]|uniref:Secreted protein n=1 Tax=Metarhizium rileyi (strain RCEF 4871) TaxID=1649241 RepID=A0A167J183_METRR|nr:secreted protein [Metarhizium rileyi RCEF 4871]